MKKKRAIFSAGGTGGHLFPAQSLAESLLDFEILFVAGGLASSRYFDVSRFAFREISCGSFSKHPLRLIANLFRIVRGFFQSLRILRNYRPDLVVGFGSFFTFPLLLAAAVLRIPIVLHEQNAVAGKVNSVFAKHARVIGVQFPEAALTLKGKSVAVAFPFRKREKMSENFGLDPEKPIILIFGGSQGATNLNSMVLQAAFKLTSFQFLHFTGNEKQMYELEKEYQRLGVRFCVKTFESKMAQAMHLAHIAVTRAGAATIAELIELEKPALVVPFPFATDDHQMKNGEHFVFKAGGGELHREESLNPDKFAQAVLRVYDQREEKKKKIQEYKKNLSQTTLEQLIRGIIAKREDSQVR